MRLLLICRSSQLHAGRLDSTVTPDVSRTFDYGSILGFYHVGQVWASLCCCFLNKLENNAQQNPDQWVRTCVIVSLRLVSTCWPWPPCCPTRIAAVLLWITWWLVMVDAETLPRRRPAFVQCLRGVERGMFEACCMFKLQEGSRRLRKAPNSILVWEPSSISNSYLQHPQTSWNIP